MISLYLSQSVSVRFIRKVFVVVSSASIVLSRVICMGWWSDPSRSSLFVSQFVSWAMSGDANVRSMADSRNSLP